MLVTILNFIDTLYKAINTTGLCTVFVKYCIYSLRKLAYFKKYTYQA